MIGAVPAPALNAFVRALPCNTLEAFVFRHRPGMTLTVRLDPALEAALEAYSAAEGVSKSQVVQRSLMAYLGTRAASAPPVEAREPSANYRAFNQAGLVGRGEGRGGADKLAVRKRVTGR
jgi:hypothetical protein